MYVDVLLDQPIRHALTYRLTPEALPYLQPGSLVEIFIGRKRDVAVVSQLRRSLPKSVTNVRDISRLLAKSWVSQTALKLAAKLADYTGEPPGICLFRLIVPASKKVLKVEIENNTVHTKTPIGERFHLCAAKQLRFDQYIRMAQKAKDLKQQTLIILPSYATNQLFQQLQKLNGLKVNIIDASYSPTKQRIVANSFAKGETDVLLGTRHIVGWQALSLRWLIVDDITHPAHIDEQRPYVDSATIAWLRHRTDGSHLVLGTALPTLGMIQAEERGQAKRLTVATATNSPVITSSSQQRLLSPDTERFILDAKNNKPIALIAPRTGIGGVLRCQQCNWLLQCNSCGGQIDAQNLQQTFKCYDCGAGAQKPTSCPQCTSPLLAFAGIGVESIRQRLKNELGDIPANVQLGTAQLVAETNIDFSLIVFLFADSPLLSPKLDRPFEYIRKIIEATAHAPRVTVQTRNLEHPLWKLLSANAYPTFRAILKRRNTKQLPPYRRTIHLTLPVNSKPIEKLPGATTILMQSSVNGHDMMDILTQNDTYKSTIETLRQRYPKARILTDSILDYS